MAPSFTPGAFEFLRLRDEFFVWKDSPILGRGHPTAVAGIKTRIGNRNSAESARLTMIDRR
jgi:hypothetical protein